jgi:methionyl aminopeptidase
MITKVKSDLEIRYMIKSGRILAEALDEIEKTIKVGMCGKDVSNICRKILYKNNAKPAFLGVRSDSGGISFPDVICVSVNDEIVHGIPNTIPFREGDIVSFDFGVNYRGMITDSARSVIVGKNNSKDSYRLLNATRLSLDAGIAVVRDGATVGDIASAVQAVLAKESLGIVRDLVGHGVGHELHELPNIPNYGKKGTGFVFREGMTIAIEPMATLGSYDIVLGDDGWTIRTKDGSLAAHFEDTILVTKTGSRILTRYSC